MSTVVLKVLVTSILLLSISQVSKGQDPLSFFPHHLGDIWEYSGVLPPYQTWQERIQRDSLSTDGRYYIDHSYFGRLILDTTNKTILLPPNAIRDTALYYRLDASRGASWVVFRTGQRTVFATVTAEFISNIFGQMVDTKTIEFRDSASGLLVYPTDYLAGGFGIVGRDIDGLPDGRIRGAVINGVRYGTITLAVQEPLRLPTQPFVLGQNYPNPFNPSTVIQYQLQRGEYLELRVLDLTGKTVALLFKGYQQAGIHQIDFNAAKFSSGPYIYSLRTPTGTKSRKMLLVR